MPTKTHSQYSQSIAGGKCILVSPIVHRRCTTNGFPSSRSCHGTIGVHSQRRYFSMYRALPSPQRTRCIAIRQESPIARVADRSIVGAFRDVTDEQLHQSKKMELVGRLAAGVSHDLNNLLTVVSSNLDMIEHVANSGRVGQFAAAARRAIDLSAKLTSQLLSFSRRQKMNPIVIDANQLISEFQGLMRQALGREMRRQVADRSPALAVPRRPVVTQDRTAQPRTKWTRRHAPRGQP